MPAGLSVVIFSDNEWLFVSSTYDFLAVHLLSLSATFDFRLTGQLSLVCFSCEMDKSESSGTYQPEIGC